MPEIEFEYQINPDDYAAASVLYAKLNRGSRKVSPWLFGGVILVIVSLLERDRGLSPVLLGAIGVWWILAALARLFPGVSYRRYYRRHYQMIGAESKKYRASINEHRFQVDGDDTTWRVLWQDASPKGEDRDVFMFHARGVLFIFAKRYLAEEQQQQLRLMAGLPVPA